jgi:hypothetical protein
MDPTPGPTTTGTPDGTTGNSTDIGAQSGAKGGPQLHTPLIRGHKRNRHAVIYSPSRTPTSLPHPDLTPHSPYQILPSTSYTANLRQRETDLAFHMRTVQFAQEISRLEREELGARLQDLRERHSNLAAGLREWRIDQEFDRIDLQERLRSLEKGVVGRERANEERASHP